MEGKIKLRSCKTFFPDILYKGVLFMPHEDLNLAYMGSQNKSYGWSVMDAQAIWLAKVITGGIQLPSKQDMLEDMQSWVHR